MSYLLTHLDLVTPIRTYTYSNIINFTFFCIIILTLCFKGVFIIGLVSKWGKWQLDY